MKNTMESVYSQTYPNIEYIIIDGASTDGSIEYILKNKKKETLFITEKDAGISDAFNKGVNIANGSHICFMNSGDIFAANDVVQKFVERIDDDYDAIFYGDFYAKTEKKLIYNTASSDVSQFEWYNPINHQSAFIPNKLSKNNLYDVRLKLAMDYDFWLKVISNTKFIKLEFPVATFELSGRSCNPEWRIHNIAVRRFLWHINQGKRIEISDLLKLIQITTWVYVKKSIKKVIRF